ncbi:putative ABC bile acid transporter [Emericellopsis atlantica]|uniref:ABC bile acid transporter n=1 Tax=Emericellopsis atlantica TaxID=2614577 RepID=A0A9P7ZVK0_9HYPO|nr:putative ABC bile acid transporter [Emericellopsis atlantica]KAG9259030.1 putative ABC bile acid transporter [Emericellopsis atlantica]
MHPSSRKPLAQPEVQVYIALAAISPIIFFVYLSQSIIAARLPHWLRPFAQEEQKLVAPKRRWTFWTLCLIGLSVAGLVLSIVGLVLQPTSAVNILSIIPWLSATLITLFQRPTSTPRLLLFQYFLLALAGLATYSVRFLAHSLRHMTPLEISQIGICGLAIIAIGNMPIRSPAADSSEIGHGRKEPTVHLRSPEDNLTLFQFWTMSWVASMIKMSRVRDLGVEDVWQLPYDYQHSRLYLAFRDLQGKFFNRLAEANGLDLAISAVLAVLEKVSEVSNIRLTSRLYAALDASDIDEAIFWCLVMLCLDGFRQIAKTTSDWYSRKAYERSRGETFIALFSKLITRLTSASDKTEQADDDEMDATGEDLDDHDNDTRLNRLFVRCCGRRKYQTVNPGPAQPKPPQSASNAKVVNLVRGDTYEISQRFWDFRRLVSQPVKVVFTMYYLVDIMGWPSSVGFGLMFFFMGINSILVKKWIGMERERNALSDKRGQAIHHFVDASRPLKLNGWTLSWSARILKVRAAEMRKRLHIQYIGAAISTLNVMGGASYPLASICLYTMVLGNGLPNAVIWPSLQLFAQLEASVKEAFDLISAYWRLVVPLERVHQYLDEPDRDVDEFLGQQGESLTFENASFAWPGSGKAVLHDINLSFPTGLTVIRGPVGAGKSSLLLAALNEMEMKGGHLHRPDEPIAYAQQLPWLQTKTIRENIVFHGRFDASRYNAVIRACALDQDLNDLPGADGMKLEEGGAGLSGGQKARVALARAMYSDARIMLLDDPLSALDHDTATNIVKRFIKGPLGKGRTIVMVTHRDDLVLRIADQVIDIEEGRAKIVSAEQIEEELLHPIHKEVEESKTLYVQRAGVDEDFAEVKEELQDNVATGSVPLSLYADYMRAGGWYLWVILALFYGLSRYFDISRARLLEAWGNATRSDIEVVGRGYLDLPDPHTHSGAWLLVLGGISLGQVVCYAVAQILLARICIRAAQGLFKGAIDRICRATFRYHDVTPTGQLRNRLTSDMGMVDGGIIQPLEGFVFQFIALCLSLIAIMSHQPALLVILLAVAVLFMYFFRLYVPISRCLRRMEMACLTPIISNIGIMQHGLVTIRAFRLEHRFQDKHLEAVDEFQKQDHFFWSMAFWLDFRLSISSATTRTALILFMIWYGTPASAVGFVLTQTNVAMAAVQQLCEKFAQLQLDAVSLERVNMLNKIPQEPRGSERPPQDWPRPKDGIRFEKMSFQYDEGLPTVLDEVTFEIPGGSTCAVLGRTGSGKSTIANALLVTQAASQGRVMIGGVDLAQVDRLALRSQVTYVQQDPILFPGSLRANLDPEGKYSDAECQNALNLVLGPGWSIDMEIDANGNNLSQGQRQLISIGRAVLRRSGLVILDEATASIDRPTAARVQRILREELTESTVITIAHRLEAVADANWCLRLDKGKVVECGPANGSDISAGSSADSGSASSSTPRGDTEL